MSDQSESDFLWGVKAIARALNRTERSTFHLLERGHLPAQKIGGRWVLSRSKIRALLDGEPVAA